jgi:type I restriction enzyme M protein
MHILHWLATNGTAAIVEFPGVLYRGGAELKIRQYLIDNNYVDAVIQLPKDLFFGTGIQTCILVLKKSRKESNVLFLNAERESSRIGNKNKLRPEDISTILENFKDRKDVEYLSKVVTHEQIKKNKYLLSVTSYVKAEDTREIVDIESLNKSIKEIVTRQSELRSKIDAIVADLEGKSK